MLSPELVLMVIYRLMALLIAGMMVVVVWRERVRGRRPLLHGLRPGATLLDEYINAHYHAVETFGAFTIMEGGAYDLSVIDVVRDDGSIPAYTQGSGMELPYENASFDIVTSLDTLEHIPNANRPQSA